MGSDSLINVGSNDLVMIGAEDGDGVIGLVNVSDFEKRGVSVGEMVELINVDLENETEVEKALSGVFEKSDWNSDWEKDGDGITADFEKVEDFVLNEK